MIIKTKKYALDQKLYINLALRQWLRSHWKWLLIPLALIILNIALYATGVATVYWPAIVLLLLTILYVLFWAIQITGIAQMEQSKPLFDKYVYEIDSRQIMLRINPREGGILKWDQIKEVEKSKDAYLLYMDSSAALNNAKAGWLAKTVTKGLSKAQFIYLPYSIFNNDHDLKFMDVLLRRKGYLAGGAPEPK